MGTKLKLRNINLFIEQIQENGCGEGKAISTDYRETG
jgi:hypothetical protein